MHSAELPWHSPAANSGSVDFVTRGRAPENVEYRRIQSAHATLQTQYNELQSAHSTLMSEFGELQRSHATLQADYVGQDKRLTEALGRVEAAEQLANTQHAELQLAAEKVQALEGEVRS